MSNYPAGWPACACGKPVMDGHLTCGEAKCSESGARRRQGAASSVLEMPAASHEASPTNVALFLAAALHHILAHIDTLELDDYFAAVQSRNRFALVLERINGEASSALSVAGAHSIFEQHSREIKP